MRTVQNKLSAFLLTDAGCTVQRILSALALTANKIGHLDYAIFPEELLQELGLEVSRTPGQTLDETVNTCHLDIQILTGGRLTGLARALQEKAQFYRVQETDIEEWVTTSLKSGDVKAEDLPERIHEDLVKRNLV